ncbi:MAG: response regulator [bacterium]|nr:response regulator [bacterium]
MTDAHVRSYAGRTALVVDDDPDVLEQIRLFLERLGFRVLTGESQAEGEALIEGPAPDLCVFDLMMENHDSGFVLAHRLKKKHPLTPVILVTGVAHETGYAFDAATAEMRRWVKADAVLDKDIRFEQLAAEIARLVKE